MPVFPETPFGITIDLSFWQWFFDLPLPEAAKVVFALGAWTILAFAFIQLGAQLWAEYREKTKHASRWEWVLLAVDIPPLLIQTPKAVEQIFAHLSGAVAHTSVSDKFWHGKKQKWFSFEIVSIEGYIQFLVRSEVEYRDLIEAAIYAQYPEAEITEVEDYVTNIPDRYPNNDYDIMGVEFKLADKDAYPIRTYDEFEYNLSKDAVFSDPMAAILENFTRINHGENLWMEIIIEPTGNHWKEEGIELVKKLMGHETHGHHGAGVGDMFIKVIDSVATELFNLIRWSFAPAEESHHEEHKEKVELTPGGKTTIESIEKKISKIGFKSKLRILYAARKEVFNPTRCVEGFIGSMNQFHIMSSNALVPALSTHAHYDRTHRKSNKLKNSFIKAFKNRKMKWKKFGGYMLNIEELATVWHFPLPFVKTPLLHKAGYKRVEPPSGLPVELSESPLKQKAIAPPPTLQLPVENEEDAVPEDLPYA